MKIRLLITIYLSCFYSYSQVSKIETVNEVFQRNKPKLMLPVLKQIPQQAIKNKRIPPHLQIPLHKELQDLDLALTELEKAIK